VTAILSVHSRALDLRRAPGLRCAVVQLFQRHALAGQCAIVFRRVPPKPTRHLLDAAQR
jgi:hypothetical protein